MPSRAAAVLHSRRWELTSWDAFGGLGKPLELDPPV